jgi:hypothetical protein
MKRAVLLLALAAALFLIGRAIVRGLASDETKIRRVVEQMADGFDRTRMDPVLEGLARDFEDETSGATRQELREALAYLFFEAVDKHTKRFAYRVEVEIQRITVEGTNAVCELNARFLRVGDAGESPAWEIAVTASFTRGDDGWRIRRTRHTTKSGERLR